MEKPSGDLADPFENMRTGLYAIRDKYEDATVMSPYQVLWLHTMGSADVLGVKDKLGSLERGKFADFLVMDPAGLGAVLEDPYANLVLVTSERDIEQVFVGGELKVDHGRWCSRICREFRKKCTGGWRQPRADKQEKGVRDYLLDVGQGLEAITQPCRVRVNADLCVEPGRTADPSAALGMTKGRVSLP